MKQQPDSDHCDEVRKVLYGRPPFLVRHGMTVLAVAIAAAVAAMVIADWPRGMARLSHIIFSRQFF